MYFRDTLVVHGHMNVKFVAVSFVMRIIFILGLFNDALQPEKLHVFVFGATALQWVRASSFTGFLDHTQRRTTVGRIPLDE